MNKKLLIVSIVMVVVCLGTFLFLRFYHTQNLYINPKSDQDLIDILFDTEFPGYREFKVLESEGIGIRRIPRQIQVAVTLEAYPQLLICSGEIFYDIGDPMALNVQWNTIECVGQMVLMERARSTMSSGLNLDACHAEIINNLLAYWIREDIIDPEEILSPELGEILLDLANDEEKTMGFRKLNAGLFDTNDVVVHPVADTGDSSEPAYVLRCDGRVDLYLVKYWNEVYNATTRQAGDIFLPDTLSREEVLQIQEMEVKKTAQGSGAEVEVTVLPETCSGWTCDISGTLYGELIGPDKILPGENIFLSHSSYCSPTKGIQMTETDIDGKFLFEIYLHDTDSLTFELEINGYQPYKHQVKSMDCLYCSCSPLDLVLEP